MEDTFVRVQPYKEQMQILLDIQLDFEAFKLQAQSNPGLFPPNSGVGAGLELLEKYLNKIWDEYVTHISSITDGQPPTLPLARLHKLKDFIGERQDRTHFDIYFKGSFHSVVAALQKLIVA